MPKPLFAVYHDAPSPTAPLVAPASSSSSARPKPSSTKRKSVLGPKATAPAGVSRPGKENVDPFSTFASRKSSSPPSCGPSSSLPHPSGPEPRPRGADSKSINGICTGTLRTRVLPPAAFDLPPLRPLRRPRGVPAPRLFRAMTAPPCSPASVVDSGYARSDDGSPENRDDDDDYDDGQQEQDRTAGSRHAHAEGESDDMLNRRARALTESPLADVTEAFTGAGAFRLPPHSPTKRSRPSLVELTACDDGLSRALKSLRV